MARLRTCVLCGKKYEYCPRCDETKPTFYLKYCGENCRDISTIMNKYTFKHLNQEAAAMELSKLNLELDKYKEQDREYIEGILAVAKKPEPIVEEVEVQVEPEAETEVETEVEVEREKPFRRPKRR